jgi:hypothetical protein
MAKNRIGFATDFVLSNNKVGIGTTNPTERLTVFGNVKIAAIGATATENINLAPYTEEGGALSFENDTFDAQHFSVTNDVSSVVFAVNDGNAEPYLQVINSGVTSIRDGEFGSLKGVALGSTESEKISIFPYTEEGGALSFEGADYETQHFSVTNEPSNILFAINNEDADPVFEITNTGVTTFTDGNFRKFSGVAVGATESEVVTMLPYTEEGGALSFENVVGSYQHLSLTNEIGGDIFAVNDDNANPVIQVSNSGIIHSGITTVGVGSTSTPPSNSQMSFELTSNTNIRIKVRGTDGVLRSGNITLA